MLTGHGAGARHRLCALRRLALSRGARPRPRAARRDLGYRSSPRAGPCSSAARPSSSRCSECSSFPARSCAASRSARSSSASSRWSPRSRCCPPCWACSGDRVDCSADSADRQALDGGGKPGGSVLGRHRAGACCGGLALSLASLGRCPARPGGADLRDAHRHERCDDVAGALRVETGIRRPAARVSSGRRRSRPRSSSPSRRDSRRLAGHSPALRSTLADDPRFGPGRIERSADGQTAVLTVPGRGRSVGRERDRRRPRPALRDRPGSLSRHGRGSARRRDDGGEHRLLRLRHRPGAVVIAFVLGLTFVLLTIVFRSIVIAGLSVVLNLLSVGAAFGLLVLVFQHGVGAGLFGFQQVGLDRGVGAALPLLGALRAVDGLPGLHAQPDQGAPRGERRHARRGLRSASPRRHESSPARR